MIFFLRERREGEGKRVGKREGMREGKKEKRKGKKGKGKLGEEGKRKG